MYIYRRDETRDRLPTAPYVLREPEPDIPQHPPNPKLCGTMNGYWQHRRYHQAQCPRCEQAQTQYGAQARARQKGG